VEFDSSGNRVWGTLFGGNDNDYSDGLSVGANGDLYFCGTTYSPNGFATPGTHQDTLTGEADAYIACFTATGQKKWVTYYGGEMRETARDIAALPNGGAIAVGWTQSKTGIATAGAHQDTAGKALVPGQQSIPDAFIARFNGNGNLQWGTFYGGAEGSELLTLSISDTALLAGGTTVSRNNISTPRAYQETFTSTIFGGADGFSTQFSLDGKRVWGSYYGDEIDDRIQGIKLDTTGYYAIGTTTSRVGFGTSGTHMETSNGVSGFLSSFSGQVRMKSTYFGVGTLGAGGQTHSNGIITSDNAFILSGYSSEPKELITSPAYDSIIDGQYDGYLAVFDSTFNLAEATYFGGEKEDRLLSSISSINTFYVAGFTESEMNISTDSTWQDTLNGARDAYIARWDLLPFVQDSVVALRQADEAPKWQIYPNPVHQQLTIHNRGILSGKHQVEVRDLTGRTLHREVFAGNTFQLSISHFPAGVYLLTIKTQGAKSTYRILKL